MFCFVCVCVLSSSFVVCVWCMCGVFVLDYDVFVFLMPVCLSYVFFVICCLCGVFVSLVCVYGV